MPRRNHRPDIEPLDLTDETLRQPIPVHANPEEARRARAQRQREAAERQRNARVNGGIDWSVCLVPGCGAELALRPSISQPHAPHRDHTVALPLCYTHLAVAYHQAQASANDALMVKTSTAVAERKEAKRAEQEAQAKVARSARTDGHIYFVRHNGIVKVGWSRDVHARLRDYGPLAHVLCIYPGTRDDETNLHRQLRPALIRGREWYEDGKIIADFVAQVLATHGPPTVHDEWTKPRAVIKPRSRKG